MVFFVDEIWKEVNSICFDIEIQSFDSIQNTNLLVALDDVFSIEEMDLELIKCNHLSTEIRLIMS